MSAEFIRRQPELPDYWRAIILFGRNVASYKFALAKSLLELRPSPGQLVRLEELAVPFANHVCSHLRSAQKQSTSPKSRFLEACRQANSGDIRPDQLFDATVQFGFNHVIDAFHIVGQAEVPARFFVEEPGRSGGIRITDAFGRLASGNQATNLPDETEARWRLVETAWELGLSRALVTVNHDAESEGLFVLDRLSRRRPVTGARQALSGYQKGQCFYCNDTISLLGDTLPDVDHFFPHTLKTTGLGTQVDGVWNLVLACVRCNRGTKGKFDRVPTIRLLDRLNTRNEFLIGSHHPLRETLMAQTGASTQERQRFLSQTHGRALALLIHEWEPPPLGDPPF